MNVFTNKMELAGKDILNSIVQDITARKQAEEALRQSEEQFRTLAESIPNLAWWANGDGYITWYNRRWYEYTGTTPAQMEGWGWQSVHDPLVLPNVLERWKASIATGEPFDMEFPLRGADGIFRTFLTRVIPLKDSADKVIRWFGTNTEISALKQAGEALRQSEALYRGIGESIDYGIWVCAPDGQNTYASESFLKMVGITQEQCSNFGWVNTLHPDDAERSIAAWQECVRTGGVWDIELRYRSVDGQWRYLLARGVPVKNEQGEITCWAGINLDISKRKHVDEMLQKSEERYRTLFNTLLEGFCIIEVLFDAGNHPVDYRFLEMNPAFEIQTGLLNAQGKLMRELAPEHEARWFEVYGKVALTGEPVHFVNEAKALNRWFNVTAYKVDGRDSRKVAILFNDITEEKRAEESLKYLNEELESLVSQRTAELREKDKILLQQSRQAAMGEMIGNIAHQWRQPLNALGLAIQQLSLFYDLGELDREYLDQCVCSSMELIKHMSKTIDDFRNYFRPDKEKTEFKVHEAITNTLSLIEDSFNNQHIGIEIVAMDDPSVLGYRNEFAQALLNILNNARDALIETKSNNSRITITLCSEGNRAVITISDNAGGIPEEIMGKIFDPYFTTKGPHAGTGVGLFMSKAIIEKNMGGRLAVRNANEGAEFRIEV